MRILVVDDERDFCEFVCEVFEEHHVQFVESGAAAQKLLEVERDFDIVLCDLMMADVTGMDLHAWLSEHHPEVARRTAFVTGGAFSDSARTFLERIQNPVIYKPFSISELTCFVISAADGLDCGEPQPKQRRIAADKERPAEYR